MSEKVTFSLTRVGLLLIALVLAIGALITAGVLNFVVKAPPEFVMLITCLSPPALIMLLYIGWVIRNTPDKENVLMWLKVLCVLSLCMGTLIFLDYVLTPHTVVKIVKGRIPRANEYVIGLDGSEQAISKSFYDELVEGDAVKIKITPILKRTRSITGPKRAQPGYVLGRGGKILLALVAVPFFLPLGVLSFNPARSKPERNMQVYFLLVVPSYILSLIAAGLLIKLLLENLQSLI
jgi:hypothetical protein